MCHILLFSHWFILHLTLLPLRKLETGTISQILIFYISITLDNTGRGKGKTELLHRKEIFVSAHFEST